MSDKTSRDFAFAARQGVRPEAKKVPQRAGKRRAVTDYDKAQEALQKNYERLKAERLAREAAKSNAT
jgi:uncharacterized small protein (DUF1192 family)